MKKNSNNGRLSLNRLLAVVVILVMTMALFGCNDKAVDNSSKETTEDVKAEETETVKSEEETTEPDASEVEKSGEILILFTSDVHCGINQGFGYAGIKAVKDNAEKQGKTVILVDNGDAIQGEAIGMVTEGESIINLMNEVGYDIAVPGNHEFDYGMDQFFKLAEMANFQYLSCNLNKEGELVFPAYTVMEKEGIKIGFVGVTTPTTVSSSTPELFKNEEGEFIYGFLQDESGETLYNAVQEAVDAARADGADYVYLVSHLGMASDDAPWTYADVVEHTSGIDVLIDGHSHDTEQVVMKNKDGEDVVRSGVGTKAMAIGYSLITPEDGIAETNIWTWNNSMGAQEVLGIENNVSKRIDEEMEALNEKLSEVIAKSSVDLTIFDPEEKDEKGTPIRMVRRAETNAGDFCADAYRIITGADIGISNGGGIRADIKKGDVTYGDILTIAPFNNQVTLVEATGQQILDALEFGTKGLPGEFGGFLQVSGLTYEIDMNVPSGCQTDENGMMTVIEGERRVKNVKVGGEPIDPSKTYTVGGINYTLTQNGDGHTAFNGAKVINDRIKPDSQALIEYIQGELDGIIGTGYEDPYGEGRIVFLVD